jgi:hypothetical protein
MYCSLSFCEFNYVEAFKEYEYELLTSTDGIDAMISGWSSHANIIPYECVDLDEEESNG